MELLSILLGFSLWGKEAPVPVQELVSIGSVEEENLDLLARVRNRVNLINVMIIGVLEERDAVIIVY